jgi:hypothetical protein
MLQGIQHNKGTYYLQNNIYNDLSVIDAEEFIIRRCPIFKASLISIIIGISTHNFSVLFTTNP